MKLTSDQLETIRQNLRVGGIKYQDVLDELLDHYATGIEARLTQGMTFDDAYTAIQNDFGKVEGPWWNPFVHPGLAAFQQQYLLNARRRVRQAHGRILRNYLQGFPLLLTGLVGLGLYLTSTVLVQSFSLAMLVNIQVIYCLLPPLLAMLVEVIQYGRAYSRLAFRQALFSQASSGFAFANLFFALPRLITKSPEYLHNPWYLFAVLSITLAFWMSYAQLYRKASREKFA